MTSSAFILSTCFSTHNFLSSVGNSYPLLCLDISTLKLHHFVAYIGHLLSSSSKDDFRCKMVIIITCPSCVSPTYRNSYLTKNDFVNLFVQILSRDSITRDRFPHFLKYSLSKWQMENMYISRFLQHRKYRNKERITAHREGVWKTETREREGWSHPSPLGPGYGHLDRPAEGSHLFLSRQPGSC